MAVFTIFTQMSILPSEGQTLLYQKVLFFWTNHVLLCKVLVSLMLLLETVFIQRFYSLNRFSENQTFMPSAVFLGVVCASGVLTTFTPVWFTSFFLSFIMIYYASNHNEKPVKNKILATGVVIALATLFDFHAVWLAIFMLCTLAANRFASLKDGIILLAGALLVYVYVFTFHFLRDSLHEWSLSYAHYHFFEIVRDFKSLTLVDYVLAGFVVVSLSYVSTALKLFYDNKLIILRKRYALIILLSFFMLVAMMFSGMPFKQGFLYMLVPITLFFSMLGLLKRRRIFHDILFVALLVLLCL